LGEDGPLDDHLMLGDLIEDLDSWHLVSPRSIEYKRAETPAFCQRVPARRVASQDATDSVPSVIGATPSLLGVIDFRHDLGRLDNG
jgi:hypothetical protein